MELDDAMSNPEGQKDEYIFLPNMATSPQQRKQAKNTRSSLDQSAEKICHILTQSLEQRTALAEEDDKFFVIFGEGLEVGTHRVQVGCQNGNNFHIEEIQMYASGICCRQLHPSPCISCPCYLPSSLFFLFHSKDPSSSILNSSFCLWATNITQTRQVSPCPSAASQNCSESQMSASLSLIDLFD
jgi:hypothetical protein